MQWVSKDVKITSPIQREKSSVKFTTERVNSIIQRSSYAASKCTPYVFTCFQGEDLLIGFSVRQQVSNKHKSDRPPFSKGDKRGDTKTEILIEWH